MKIIKNKLGIETKIFAQTFEYEAYDQVKNLANYEPYNNSKIRIMPDAHAGKGCTVGTTMTISDKVTPNLVGVDIGCGMLVVELKDSCIEFNKLDDVIRAKIPHGFNVHDRVKAKFDFTDLRCQKFVDTKRAMLSIGSLGGGNHFIEIGFSEKNNKYYLIIHSGSRKLGGDTCKYYQDLAFQGVNEMKTIKENLIKQLKKEERIKDLEGELRKLSKPRTDKTLAHLDGALFDDYMNDMHIVQQFAVHNRKTIADIIVNAMGFSVKNAFETIHNYIDFKRMILRKGAVSAEVGEVLIIPMNMRDGSLLCVGKGNEDWNYSAPHGAGRLMSRSKAREQLSVEEFKKSMGGIYTTSVSKETLDEAPDAYKPMDEIIQAVEDTVEIIDILRPLYNFKSSNLAKEEE